MREGCIAANGFKYSGYWDVFRYGRKDAEGALTRTEMPRAAATSWGRIEYQWTANR